MAIKNRLAAFRAYNQLKYDKLSSKVLSLQLIEGFKSILESSGSESFSPLYLARCVSCI